MSNRHYAGPERRNAGFWHWIRKTDTRLLVFYAVVTLAFAILTQLYVNTHDDLNDTRDSLHHTQVQLDHAQGKITKNLRDIQETRYQSCLGGRAILLRYNANQQALRALAMSRTDLPDNVRADMIKIYDASLIKPVPHCVRL